MLLHSLTPLPLDSPTLSLIHSSLRTNTEGVSCTSASSALPGNTNCFSHSSTDVGSSLQRLDSKLVLEPLRIVNRLPSLLSERLLGSQFFLFKFWFNGRVCDGLRYQDKLFHLSRTFKVSQRNKAYEIGCEFERKGIKAAITFSGENYRLWTDLCGFTTLQDDGDRPCEELQSQYHNLEHTQTSYLTTAPTQPKQPSQLILQSMQC